MRFLLQRTITRPILGIFGFLLAIGVLGGLATGIEIWQQGFSSVLQLAPQDPEVVWKLEVDPVASTSPQVTARAYWLYERSTGSLLASSNAETATSVASLAKLMTAYVSYDTYPLDTVLTVGSASAVLGNRAKFLPQDQYRVYELLQALLIFSANDAAETLAQGDPNGREMFVKKMNDAAVKLELHQTRFENPTGLDAEQQLSSAGDLGHLTDTLLNIPTFSQIVSRSSSTIREQRTGRPSVVYSTNALLGLDPRYQGVKTGTTDLAGESLITRFVDPEATSAATPNGTDWLLVVLGSEHRFIDAQALIKWAQIAAKPVQHTLE